jgi:hypothetical protein
VAAIVADEGRERAESQGMCFHEMVHGVDEMVAMAHVDATLREERERDRERMGMACSLGGCWRSLEARG